MPETADERHGRQMFEASRYIGWDAWDELHPAVRSRMIDDAAELYERWHDDDLAAWVDAVDTAEPVIMAAGWRAARGVLKLPDGETPEALIRRGREGATMATDNDECPLSQRVDGKLHSFRFDGDDPYLICAYCGQVRDALTGRVLRPGTGAVQRNDDDAEPVVLGEPHRVRHVPGTLGTVWRGEPLIAPWTRVLMARQRAYRRFLRASDPAADATWGMLRRRCDLAYFAALRHVGVTPETEALRPYIPAEIEQELARRDVAERGGAMHDPD